MTDSRSLPSPSEDEPLTMEKIGRARVSKCCQSTVRTGSSDDSSYPTGKPTYICGPCMSGRHDPERPS